MEVMREWYPPLRDNLLSDGCDSLGSNPSGIVMVEKKNRLEERFLGGSLGEGN